MKVCLIGHSDFFSPYGASTSLRSHLESFQNDTEFKFYCIYRKSFKLPSSFHSANRPNLNLVSLKAEWLPIMYSAIKSQGFSIKQFLFWRLIPNLISFFYSKKFLDKLVYFQPDIIHLNSLVLLPLIKKIRNNHIIGQVKIILHIRELANNELDISSYEHLIDKFVFIDQATFDSFKSNLPNSLCRSIIIQNPFCVSLVDNTGLNIPKDDYVNFAIVGVISDEKGIEFVLKVFSKIESVKIRCYVVGKSNVLKKNLQKKYAFSKHIIWVDEINNFAKNGGFTNIDFLVRGDNEFCTGRTVYEALLSGSNVILPGNISNLISDKVLNEYESKIYLYQPRNTLSLLSLIQNIGNLKIKKELKVDNLKLSNYKEYYGLFKREYSILMNNKFIQAR